MIQPVLFQCPIARLEPIPNKDANKLLVDWEHKLGPCYRPFRTESFAFFIREEPVAVAMSCSIVHGPIEGYTTENLVELARLASSNKWSNRIMIRGWRELFAPLYAGWKIKAAVSYSHNALHGGNTYRTDGWRKVCDKRGTDGKGGNWGRRGKGYKNTALHGKKTLWIWEYTEPAE